MASPVNIIVGSHVWVEDPVLAWIDGEVTRIDGQDVHVQTTNGKKVVSNISKAFPKDTEAPPGGVDDMTKLSYLHEPGVLQNLATRYELNEIYTYTGNILIAVNPFQRLPHLYDTHMMEQYKGAALGELSPHVFAIGDVAYRAMMNEGKSNSILVSGESGAGVGIEETAATANASPDPPPSSADKEELEYVVFRNEISLSSESPKLPESAAPDYFSLDVGNEESDGAANLREEGKDREGSVRADDVAPIVAAKERTLEGKWFSGNSRFKSPMLRLHTEILDFCNFLSPTLEEQESRDAAIEAVSNVIKYIWPNVVVEVFGSFKTGLYLPSSDIDVVILGSNVKTPQIGLQALSRALSQRGIAKNIQVIAKARVPIIKFVEKRSGIAFDVSFDVANGPKAAEFIKDAISKWPPLKPLCLILKVFLQQRELNEVYTGGISSYALLSMLIAMLRTQLDRPASPEHNLGVLLVNFFDLYGCKLNTAEVGISCNGGGIFFPKSIKGFVVEDRTSRIAIEDPQAPDNDIGKSSFNYYKAKSAFAMAFTTLSNAKFISRLGADKSILSAIIRPDSVLLERKGGSSGKSTLNNLFPDSGEQHFADHQEIYCNWPSNDDDEDGLLPRGNGIVTSSETNCDVIKSSGRKRKSSKEQRSGKKMKDREENGQYSGQRPSLRRHRGDSNSSSGYDHHGSGSSKWI